MKIVKGALQIAVITVVMVALALGFAYVAGGAARFLFDVGASGWNSVGTSNFDIARSGWEAAR